MKAVVRLLADAETLMDSVDRELAIFAKELKDEYLARGDNSAERQALYLVRSLTLSHLSGCCGSAKIAIAFAKTMAKQVQ